MSFLVESAEAGRAPEDVQQRADLDEPVRIKLNGRKAFEGVLERRVDTLLDVAASDWDFDRLFCTRIRVKLGRRGKQM